MARHEPAWLTVVYQIVGIIVIALIASILWMIANYWLLFLLLGTVGGGAYFFYTHPAAVEWRKQREGRALFARLQYLVEQRQFPDADKFARDTIDQFLDSRIPQFSLVAGLLNAAHDLYQQEHLTHVVPPPPVADSIEGARWRDKARASIEILSLSDALGQFRKSALEAYTCFADTLPPAALSTMDQLRADADAWKDEQPRQFVIPVMDLLPNTGKTVEELVMPFFKKEARPLFANLRAQLDKNQQATGTMPTEYVGENAIRAYLQDTPLLQIFDAHIPFVLPEYTRFAGHWIVAPPGRGKTTLLSSMFLEDLKRDASIIIMDSKGELLDPIRRLSGLQDRLVILEPDLNHPLALNPLDLGKDGAALSDGDRQLLVNRKVSYLESLFGGMLEAKMTSLQSRYFRVVLRALLTAAKSPTLATFRNIAQRGYQPYLDLSLLTDEDRAFFQNEFDGRTYSETRQQILWRLGLLLDNPVFKAMFAAPRTKVDMAALMDSGKIVLINNSKALLDDIGAEFFGRFFLALVRTAAQQRAGRNEKDKRPVYFYIDECQSVIRNDDNIATIIDECRSQKIAMIMAHQRVAQIVSKNVLDALANCAIRFANSDEDAHQLAPAFRTKPTYLHQPRGCFAAFVRDTTDTAITLRVPPVNLSTQPKMSDAEYLALIKRIHALYCDSETHGDIDRPISEMPVQAEHQIGDELTGPAKY